MRCRTFLEWAWLPCFASLAALAPAAQGQLERSPAQSVSGLTREFDGERVVLEGIVLEPSGAPTEGAVVVSSAGGRAVTDLGGRYRLETLVPPDAVRLQVTALGSGSSGSAASTTVPLPVGARATLGPLQLSAGCEPTWTPHFGPRSGPDEAVKALAVFDDGGGPELYLAGEFTRVGGVAASYVAKWDGSEWSAVGGGVNGFVFALEVLDDGRGPALYAGGDFTTAGGASANGVARWDGVQWTALGSGVAASGAVYALDVFDDGGGAALYAGGTFFTAGGAAASCIAKWDGSSWSALGAGTSSTVRALAVHDDGSGPALFVGGNFGFAGGAPARRIARWDGSSWSALGTGFFGAVHDPYVLSMAEYDDGGGPVLYVGGFFDSAGGVPVGRVARWDGASWSPAPFPSPNFGSALLVHDDGGGPALYAGGSSSVVRWDGSSSQSLSVSGSGPDGVEALAFYDDGTGDVLVAGTESDESSSRFVMQRKAGSWSPLDRGMHGVVEALAVHDDGSGPAVFVGGDFSTPDLRATRLAKWDGTSWTQPGAGVNGVVRAMTVMDDGGGPALFVGGDFTTAGGAPANRVARWDGASWSALGSGVSSAFVLAAFDDGGGPALYAGGLGGVSKWTGSSWVAIGTASFQYVHAMVVHDDGSGPALYAGGTFSSIGGDSNARGIARWNGASWSALGSGLSGSGSQLVSSLAVFDDGLGAALYAGGRFTSASGVAVSHIAKWSGSSWSSVGGGLNIQGQAVAMRVFDDGSGSALHVGGFFATAGGTAVKNIARWDGSSWTALGGGTDGSVSALTACGHTLVAGGRFDRAYDSNDGSLATWTGCPDLVAPVLSCPQSVSVVERRSGPPGEHVEFTVTATDNLDPAPSVVCVPPSGSFFPAGTTLVSCVATDDEGNEATCQFPVVVSPRERSQALDD